MHSELSFTSSSVTKVAQEDLNIAESQQSKEGYTV